MFKKIILLCSFVFFTNCLSVVKHDKNLLKNNNFSISDCVKNDYIYFDNTFKLRLNDTNFSYHNNTNRLSGVYNFSNEYLYGNYMFTFSKHFVCYFNVGNISANKIYQFGKCFKDFDMFDLECVLNTI